MFDDLPHVSVAVKTMRFPWDLIRNNGHEIGLDAYYLHAATFGVEHLGHVHEAAIIDWPDRVTIEQGAVIKAGAVLDAEHGPIVVASGAVVMPGAVIEGPAYVGPGSVIKVHAKIYGDTSIGPVCKVGGEVECSIIHGYSNKQHDGFLGHSYIAEWVNIGAGTNNSDLKNNYSPVRMQIGGEAIDTGLTFMGVLVGDHTKTAIGSTLNTGTVVGPGCNIFGAGLPPKLIPAFSWGGAEVFETYDIDRCMECAKAVMQRRNVDFTTVDEVLFREVFHMTADERAAAGVEVFAGT
jgi:UDP-N-acetylglucosamine diphosphorylase/glucosamine-1-phosphate N-acetyltransferase